jgi:hypothetical protein
MVQFEGRQDATDGSGAKRHFTAGQHDRLHGGAHVRVPATVDCADLNQPTTPPIPVSHGSEGCIPGPARNPSFGHELAYPNVRLPDAGFQLLALYRFWNIIELWYPYRDGIANWDAALAESLPRIALAKDRNQYQLEMTALIAKVNDTHANLWSSLAVRPPPRLSCRSCLTGAP